MLNIITNKLIIHNYMIIYDNKIIVITWLPIYNNAALCVPVYYNSV